MCRSPLSDSEAWKNFLIPPLDLDEHGAISTPVSSGSGLLLVLEYHGYAIEFEPVLHRRYSLG
jgi:hypothetical protein